MKFAVRPAILNPCFAFEFQHVNVDGRYENTTAGKRFCKGERTIRREEKVETPKKPQDHVSCGLTEAYLDRIYTVDVMLENLHNLAVSKLGIEIVERKLASGGASLLRQVLHRLTRDALMIRLMYDERGQELVLLVLRRLPQAELRDLVCYLQFDLPLLSQSLAGSKCVLEIIQLLTSKQGIAVLNQSLGNSLLELAQSPNGREVLVQCFNYFQLLDMVPLLKSLHRNFSAILETPSSTYFLKALLAYTSLDVQTRLLYIFAHHAVLLLASEHSEVLERALDLLPSNLPFDFHALAMIEIIYSLDEVLHYGDLELLIRLLRNSPEESFVPFMDSLTRCHLSSLLIQKEGAEFLIAVLELFEDHDISRLLRRLKQQIKTVDRGIYSVRKLFQHYPFLAKPDSVEDRDRIILSNSMDRAKCVRLLDRWAQFDIRYRGPQRQPEIEKNDEIRIPQEKDVPRIDFEFENENATDLIKSFVNREIGCLSFSVSTNKNILVEPVKFTKTRSLVRFLLENKSDPVFYALSSLKESKISFISSTDSQNKEKQRENCILAFSSPSIISYIISLDPERKFSVKHVDVLEDLLFPQRASKLLVRDLLKLQEAS